MIAIYHIHNDKRRNKHGVHRKRDKNKTRKTVKGTWREASKEEKLLFLGIRLTFSSMITFPASVVQRLCDGGGKDVGVTGIDDGHGGATEELTGGSTELNLF